MSSSPKIKPCPICCDQFKDPRVLPCCHTFCTDCLRKLSKESGDGRLACPLCRNQHKIPLNGVSGFLEDYSVPHRREFKDEHDNDTVTLTCQQCDTSEDAISYCSVCRAYLCAFCSQVHQRQNRYKDHADKMTSFTTSPPKHQCEGHSEPLKVYCQTCRCLVCCECVVESHQRHVYKSINSATRAEVEADIGELVEIVRKNAEDLKDKMDYMNCVEVFVIERAEKLRKEIDLAYQKMLGELNRSRKNCLNKVDELATKDLKVTWADKNSAELKYKTLQATLELANRTKKCTDTEMLRLSGQLIQSMEALRGTSLSIDVGEIEKIHRTRCNFQSDYPNIELGSIMSRIKKATFSMCILEQPKSVPLGLECSFCVQIQLRCFPFPNIDVSFTYGKSKKKLSEEKIVIETQDRLIWKIKFIPVCSGEHAATVSASSGLHVKRSEFSFNAYGRPSLRSLIQRGPDWDSKRYQLREYDGGAGKTGIVTSSFYCTGGVLIDWTEGRYGHPCRWGSDGCYDVELK